MNNVEKHILKQDAQDQEDWEKYLQKENEAYKARIKTLEAEIRILRLLMILTNLCMKIVIKSKNMPSPTNKKKTSTNGWKI